MSNESSLIVRFGAIGSAEMLAALDGVVTKGTAAQLVTEAFGSAQDRAAKQLMANTIALEAQVAVYRDPAYDRIIERYKDLREEMTKLAAPTRTLSSEMEAFTGKVENNILALKAQIAVLNTEAGAAQMAEQGLLKAQLKSLTHPNTEVLGPSRQDIPVSELEKVTSSYQAQNAQLKARLEFFKDPANKQAIEDQRAMKKELDDMNEKSMPGLLSGWSRWSILMLGLTAAFAGLHMVESIVDATAVYEQLNARLTAIDGSADVAAVRLAKLQLVAKQPGIGLEEATKGYTALRALNETGTESINILTALAKANAAMGGGKEEFGRAIIQIEQMIGKGKVMGEDIRSLSNSIPNFRGLMLEAFGTVDTKIINSKVTVNEFLLGIEEAANRLSTPSASIKNDFDNIADGWMRLKASLIDTGFIKSATGYVAELLDKMATMSEQRPGSKADKAQQEMYFQLTHGQTFNPLYIGNDEGTLKVWKQAGEYAKKAREDAEAEKSAQEAAEAIKRDADQARAKAAEEYAKHQKERERLAREAFIWERNSQEEILRLHKEYVASQEKEIDNHAKIKEKQANTVYSFMKSANKVTDPKQAVEDTYQQDLKLIDRNKAAAGFDVNDITLETLAKDKRDREIALIDQKNAEARARLMAGLKTEEELIAASYEKRRLEILNATELTEKDKLALLKRNAELEVQEESRLTEKRVSMLTSANSQLVGAIADSFKMAQGEQSAAYKAMFVTSKSFLIADAGLKIADASAEALRLPWPTNIAALAQVSANGAVIISQMNAIAGAFDSGGFIPAGKKGIVGENGMEFVEGPARVTSSRQTAAMLASGSSAPVVNIHNYSGATVEASVNPDTGDLEVLIGKVAAATEDRLASSVKRGDGPLNSALKNTYGLKRNV